MRHKVSMVSVDKAPPVRSFCIVLSDTTFSLAKAANFGRWSDPIKNRYVINGGYLL
nr:MAG TPA: hypothetical protein [Caudoviricetes sp.]